MTNMTFKEIFMLISTILGGLALFIFGMNIMTSSLRLAVGAKLQKLLSKTTRNRFSSLGLGTLLGATIHSGAATVMVLGFINAGLMTLEQSIGAVVGANIGTTLAMQAVSFKLGDYCFFAIGVGLIISMVSPGKKGKELGRAVLGFGLLFLGMELISDAITPDVRDSLKIYFASINGQTLGGVILGVLVSALLTAIWQSSGATIAIIYAMISSGVFTQFEQIFPIVLGAHIGTCIVALLGSIGTSIEARRSAISHLVFNIFNVILAIALKPLFFYMIPKTSSDLITQTANLHTFVMIIAAFALIPFTYQYAKFIRLIVPSKKAPPEPSYLDYQVMEYPERSIVAVISELQRISRVCAKSLYLTTLVVLGKFDRKTIQKIKTNEQVVDDIKIATREYLANMTKKYLSRRQIIMAHHLNKCISDIERVGDHIDELCDLSLKSPKSELDKESLEGLFTLHQKAQKVLSLVIKSLSPKNENFQESALSVLNARDKYIECSIDTNQKFILKVEKHEVSSLAALYYKEYISVMDRMIRHIESIAFAQKHEDFWIKRSKLDQKPTKVDKTKVYNVDTTDYIDKLQSQDYL